MNMFIIVYNAIAIDGLNDEMKIETRHITVQFQIKVIKSCKVN